MARIESMILGLIAGDAIGAGCEFCAPEAVQKDFPQLLADHTILWKVS